MTLTEIYTETCAGPMALAWRKLRFYGLLFLLPQIFQPMLPAEDSGRKSQPKIEFNRDIRPILSDNCFYCHGPDKNHREAELRLDTEAGLFGGGKAKSVVRKGSPDQSKLMQRVLSTDPDKQMPPPDSGKQLSPNQVETLRSWIAQGGSFEGHWAFQPVRGAKSARKKTPTEDIDALIDAKRESGGVKSVGEADRVTLLRRLHFDLTGLPPKPEDVIAFQNSSDPAAYEKQVDRLLGSEHFGERMAMWWLDLVRYADTVGYHGDQEMSVSPFRQYVIESFNANKKFDQFTREQLGGDLMRQPTREQLIASGYNRLGMMSAEGGVQDREYLAKYIAERVRNVSGTWLGVTIGCSECHDHKFDPFTTREFYQLEAFFADIKERGLYSGANSDGNWGPIVKVPTPVQENALKLLDGQIAAVGQKLNQTTPELVRLQEVWERSFPQWKRLQPTSLKSQEGTILAPQGDGSILAVGPQPKTENYVMEFSASGQPLTAIRLEVLPHESLPVKGPGRAGNGNFVLTEFVLKRVKRSGETVIVPIKAAQASYEQVGAAQGNPYKKWTVQAAIDQDAKGKNWGWAVMEKAGNANSAVFQVDPSSLAADDQKWVVELRQNHDNSGHTLGHFRLSAVSTPLPAGGLALDRPEIQSILAIAAGQRNDAQKQALAAYFRSIALVLEPLRQEIARLEKEKAAVDQNVARSLITESVAPRMVRILPRGNWMDESGDVVKPAFPAVLTTGQMQFPKDRALNRQDLAEWIVHPENPLTARVFVNRLWKIYFGEALSRKVDDLGAQGKPPTHPELLDHLASDFMQSGWDVKRMIKAIVMTHAYRQSSISTPQLKEKDPFNELIARQGRFRLDAELVRDNALAVSGLLVEQVGGKSVKPYQPPGYWAYLNFPTREWQNGKGQELYRRGLYTHWQRQYLHPSLLAFDAPNREECTADRARSNTPLQSLVLLNDPSYVEAARALAELMITQGGSSVADRLHFAYMRALSRAPKRAEMAVLESLLKQSLADFKANPQAVREFLSVGDKPVAAGVDPDELAAWTTVARAILNLHESMTRN